MSRRDEVNDEHHPNVANNGDENHRTVKPGSWQNVIHRTQQSTTTERMVRGF
jgi:hypothetical protein